MAAMVEANGLESLVLRLGNLDEGVAEEDAAVNNALSTLENMIELQPSVPPPALHQCGTILPCWIRPGARVMVASPCLSDPCSELGMPDGIGTLLCCPHSQFRHGLQVATEVVHRTTLLRWLLKRLKPREFDSNKEAAGSLLALLLQTHPPNAQALADINGVDALLQVHPWCCSARAEKRCIAISCVSSCGTLGLVSVWLTSHYAYLCPGCLACACGFLCLYSAVRPIDAVT